ncbi:MAG: radical SAM protein [Candidatus Thermoplasmatota archaeon]|nr:radical SAM protein [Candidatus Thermoplasmatota archaeon]
MDLNKRRKTVFIDARLVCDRGKLDAQRVANYFSKNGYDFVQHPKNAQVIIFNVCGFSTGMVQTGLLEIEKYKKYNADLIIIGGLPGTDKEVCEKVSTGKFLSHENLGNIDSFFPEHSIHFADIDDANHPWLTLDTASVKKQIKTLCYRSSFLKKIVIAPIDYYVRQKIGEDYLILGNPFDFPSENIYRLRISWGCNFRCSYCAIRKATGDFRSKPFGQCVKEFESGLQKGFQTFHIMSVDPGGYGKDIGSTYPFLLQTLCEYEGEYRFRLEAVNPFWLVTYQHELEEIVKKGKIRAISVPIQSGSPRILQLMNRFSDIDKILTCLQRLKTISPSLTLATNGIIGFPTETNEEFHSTLNFIKESGIDMGYLYPISLKPGTKAESIHPHFPPREIYERIKFSRKFLSQNGYTSFLTPGHSIIFGRYR